MHAVRLSVGAVLYGLLLTYLLTAVFTEELRLDRVRPKLVDRLSWGVFCPPESKVSPADASIPRPERCLSERSTLAERKSKSNLHTFQHRQIPEKSWNLGESWKILTRTTTLREIPPGNLDNVINYGGHCIIWCKNDYMKSEMCKYKICIREDRLQKKEVTRFCQIVYVEQSLCPKKQIL